MHPTEFRTVTFDEDPGTFHARRFDDVHREIWIPQLDARRTLVLGSSQAETDVDQAQLDRHGIVLARRRSGGGAVLVSAADVVWFDVIIGDGDSLWNPDIGRSFDWLGDACQQALARLGVRAEVHRGGLERNQWSSKICFAGLGPGELTVDRRKLVGMSQRRTRRFARFQVAVLRRWDGQLHRDLFATSTLADGTAAEDHELDTVATTISHSPSDILRELSVSLSTF